MQVIAFFIKPSQDSKIRRYWNWYHHWAGRLALFLAAVNAVVGIRVGGGGASWSGGYGFILALILVGCLVLEALRWRGASRKLSVPPPPAL